MNTTFTTFANVDSFNETFPNYANLDAADQKQASQWFNLVTGWKVPASLADSVGCGPGTCPRPRCSKGCSPDECVCRNVCKGRCARADFQKARKLRNKDPLNSAIPIDRKGSGVMPGDFTGQSPEEILLAKENTDTTAMLLRPSVQEELKVALAAHGIDPKLPFLEQLKKLAKRMKRGSK